jgi:hypothetical protein
MARPLFLILPLLVAAPATAATLQGQVVNGTTGETATADLVAVFVVTKPAAEPVASVENVTGAFTLEGIPEAAAAHFRLEVHANGMVFNQQISGFDAPVDAFLYDTTDDLSGVALLRHHVIFTRDPEHLQVTEFIEFDNRSDPPRVINADTRPMRVHLGHDMHGEPTASIWGMAAPEDVPLVRTDEAPILGLERALQPGSTRVVVRYLVHEENLSYQWVSKSLFDTEERKALIDPVDAVIESAGMIPSDEAIEGYATWAGLASRPGEEWVINVSGGAAVAATDDGHDHGNTQQANQASAFTDIVARPNRLTASRTQIMIGLAGLLLFGTMGVLATSKRTAPESSFPQDEARLAVSKIADQYVSGKISREEYEQKASSLVKKSPAKNRQG